MFSKNKRYHVSKNILKKLSISGLGDVRLNYPYRWKQQNTVKYCVFDQEII